ncbi:IucA/IucC family protein [Nonomuraea sp. NPDC026600]|uniref:IucA/IucC family protein n=1 Tax=Nonomuraea sp. NPDC026600 TaxID=3155363 RepID=UPI003402B744
MTRHPEGPDAAQATLRSGPDGDRADALTVTALLNCLVREVARPESGQDDGHRIYRLPTTGHLLRVRAGRYPGHPALYTEGGWLSLSLDLLVTLTAEELTAYTGVSNGTLAGEIRQSRDVVATLLSTRAPTATPAPFPPTATALFAPAQTSPTELFLRSEQALVAGHRYHPAPKARGGLGPDSWLPYAPEARARFPLTLLGVPPEAVLEEGDPTALDGLGPPPPDGCLLLPAHPWQLELLGGPPALRDGRLRYLGETAAVAVPTSSLRTVYLPDADLFCKFSLDVRITNDVRRLWSRDLRRLTTVDGLLRAVFDDLPAHLPSPSVLSDRGYRTVDLGDGGEALAVIVRDGLGAHLRPGLTALLAAGISEGFSGNPLDGLDEDRALTWWQLYLEHVVPPVLHAYLHHGVVLECHLQNVLIGVDAAGTPAQAIFRDHEGVKLVTDRHPAVPGVGAAYGWERLVSCLVTNNLWEIAGAIEERHAGLGGELWARARDLLTGYAGDHARIRALLAASHVPAKANLLLRWLGADGGEMRCVPVPNPLRPVADRHRNRDYGHRY